MGWKRYFRRQREDERLSREMEEYLEIEAEQNVARGMKPEEARFAAVRKLGSMRRIREEVHAMNSIGFLETLGQDLKYGLRMQNLFRCRQREFAARFDHQSKPWRARTGPGETRWASTSG